VVTVHTGNGLPNALPSLLIPVAREHPKLRIVVAHAGGGTFGADALVAVELAKYRSIGLSESQLEWCLGKTAASVFKLPS